VKPSDPYARLDPARLDLIALPVTPHRLRLALVAASRRTPTDAGRRAVMRVHEEVSLWQASDNATAHLRRSTATRLVEMLHGPARPSSPLPRDLAEVLEKVTAEVRRVAALRAAPLRPEEVRELVAPGALPTGRLTPVDLVIAATARLLHGAMRAPARPRSEG